MSTIKSRLLAKKTLTHEMNVLRSEGHEIYGVHVNKISLSPFDSKRFIEENGIDTFAYGYRFTDDELEAVLIELFLN